MFLAYSVFAYFFNIWIYEWQNFAESLSSNPLRFPLLSHLFFQPGKSRRRRRDHTLICHPPPPSLLFLSSLAFPSNDDQKLDPSGGNAALYYALVRDSTDAKARKFIAFHSLFMFRASKKVMLECVEFRTLLLHSLIRAQKGKEEGGGGQKCLFPSSSSSSSSLFLILPFLITSAHLIHALLLFLLQHNNREK